MRLVLLEEEINDEAVWVATCLERYLVAQGQTREEAVRNFAQTYAGQYYIDQDAGKTPLSDFGEAPEEYWRIYNTNKANGNAIRYIELQPEEILNVYKRVEPQE